MANGECTLHSGFEARIKNTEDDVKDMGAKYKDLCGKIDKIYHVMIGLLVSVTTACVLMAVNLIVP